MADDHGLRLNHAGMRELLHTPGVRGEMMRRARMVLSAAEASAPVASGAYKASLRVEEATTDRAVARVVAADPKALIIESRTGTLARALDAAGGT